jgi:hypothetical protein
MWEDWEQQLRDNPDVEVEKNLIALKKILFLQSTYLFII